MQQEAEVAMMQNRVAGAASGQSRVAAAAQSTKGSGSSRDAEVATAWQDKQQKEAIMATQGKQESARTHNTFVASAKDIAAGGLKKRAVETDASEDG